MLSEIRHLIMDMGYGFELKTTKITGLVVIIGSFLLTILMFKFFVSKFLFNGISFQLVVKKKLLKAFHEQFVC